MLKYLIEVVQALAVPLIFLGMVMAIFEIIKLYKSNKAVFESVLLALVLSAVLAFLKVNVGKISQEHINSCLNVLCVLSIITFILSAFAFKKVGVNKLSEHQISEKQDFNSSETVSVNQEQNPKKSQPFNKLINAAFTYSAGCFTFCLLFFALPDLIIAPSQFVLEESQIISYDFLYKTIGYVLGFILCLVLGFVVYKVSTALSFKYVLTIFCILGFFNVLFELGVLLQFMLARRIIPMSQLAFRIVKFTVNFSDFFIFVTLAVAAILAIVLVINSLHKKTDFENPALKRLFVATQRHNRHKSILMMVLLLLCLLDLTVVQDYQNRGYTLSPALDPKILDKLIYIPLQDVSDGHLHRFSYKSDKGIDMRFIVIKKNDTAYGIGLDACDICGSTGYYERDGQVVCMRCDVVMNISTIGYKGGCNPIPVSYSLEIAQIVIKTDELNSLDKHFK